MATSYLSLTYLATFVAVVECRSMTLAAAELGYSLSTVSGHVARLEHRLRVSLLDRSPNGVLPTAVGERVVWHAEILIGVHDRLTASVGRES